MGWQVQKFGANVSFPADPTIAGAVMKGSFGRTGRGGLFSNLWVQLALLVIAAIILVALAAKFIW